MKQLLIFLKKMHHYTGVRLYINLIWMVGISFIEGISIILIIPLLGLTGILDGVSSGGIPFLSTVMEWLQRLPFKIDLVTVLVFYVAMLTGQAMLQRSQAIMNAKIQQTFLGSMRMEIYQDLLQANWSFFLKKRRSDFNHILTNELGRVSASIYTFLRMIASLVFTLVQVGFALILSAKLTMIILVCGVGLAVVSRRSSRKAKEMGGSMSELSQNYMAALTDHFNGMKDIKSNNMERKHYQYFKSIVDRIEGNFLQINNLQTKSQFYYKTVSAILIAFFVLLSMKVLHASAGQLLIIILIFSRLWPRFTALQSSWQQIQSNLPAISSLLEVQRESREAMEVDMDAPEDQNETSILHVADHIECRHVDYRYNPSSDAYALSDINLTIPANSMTAIVGKSGAGKSTLIDMLMGLIQPEKGEVRIDDAVLSKDNVRQLRRSVSYVAQEPFLFHASIRENLLLVKPEATEEELWGALSFASADAFVQELPLGLDTVVGDRGIRLSGGERQRIVLARAILRKPSILILDEATSALDSENEAVIKSSLDLLKGSLTIIIIAHRLSTIRNADQVVVMEGGRIIQQGGYQQLFKDTRGKFKSMLAYQADVNMNG
ncbi:ABC transporter ATP-binding protein [Gorillibacterium massiliense]|uniref:ABC transporter ATP-binding protein n=1 Tax=Gorillibacterium massiliense TaxID=1280390 RepID=UPI0004B58109|nr:ABC transporter ATP-binding protein [Gorillibacterium massiliense]